MSVHLPREFTGADADWEESFRAYWYPKLNAGLVALGHAIGIPLFATGTVSWNQYVGTVDTDEEVIEPELEEAGFRRNPIACYKHLLDGRNSEGSWVLLHEDAPDYVAPGMQVHLTMFDRLDGKPGRELYAHYEDDWRVNWLGHLRETDFNAAAGVSIATDVLDHETYLVLKESKHRP